MTVKANSNWVKSISMYDDDDDTMDSSSSSGTAIAGYVEFTNGIRYTFIFDIRLPVFAFVFLLCVMRVVCSCAKGGKLCMCDNQILKFKSIHRI